MKLFNKGQKVYKMHQCGDNDRRLMCYEIIDDLGQLIAVSTVGRKAISFSQSDKTVCLTHEECVAMDLNNNRGKHRVVGEKRYIAITQENGFSIITPVIIVGENANSVTVHTMDADRDSYTLLKGARVLCYTRAECKVICDTLNREYVSAHMKELVG